ncbi:hypothetical protein K435DRAFT_674919 [Dendrothele bispora CBS 962.96]|uniref:Thioesterase domain-containing protein n=1 Tax=Dendrothele bispora (strain CBS 962.96) TaxID=1314807 RepID=A0A4S8LQ10_DENBC|nr:hypothetical protein K435DRAFT_674919 [Dendrothele bispora CBS 962.96]
MRNTSPDQHGSSSTILSDPSLLTFPSVFPPLPGSEVDVSQIRGNVSDQSKRLAVNIFSHFIGAREENFGAQVGRRLKLVEMNVSSRNGRATEAQTVFEIAVAKDMCNIYGTLHGACATYIVDPCSVSALVVLGAALGVDGTGVSQSMNLIWHQPAKIGTRLRVLSTSIYIEGRIRTSRCELWGVDDDKLYVSAVHSTVNPNHTRRISAGSKL